jgi:hypothetical protein
MSETERQPDTIAEEAAKDLELQPDQAKDVKGGIREPRPILEQLDAPPAGP